MNIVNYIASNLKNVYGFNNVTIHKNQQSTDGNVYNIVANGIKYILKVYDSLNHAEMMVNLHKKLSGCNFIVPKIISNNDTNFFEFNNSFGVLYSFLEGKPISAVDLNDEVINSLAKELKRMHNTFSINSINVDKLPFSCNAIRNSILHFDLTKDNIFLVNGKVGFIDFDDVKYGASVCDAAILVCNLFVSKTKGINKNGINSFLNAYYADMQSEQLLEKKLIKECALNWINYILDGHEFDSSTKESLEAKRELLSFLDLI